MSSSSLSSATRVPVGEIFEINDLIKNNRNHSLDAVSTLIGSLSDYFQALTGFCSAGVKLAKNFVDSSSIASIIRPKDKDEIQKIFGVWEEIDKVTQQAASTIKIQTMQALQNWIVHHQYKISTCENDGDDGGTGGPPDLSRLLSSCLVVIMQLQYQFCLMHSQSFTKGTTVATATTTAKTDSCLITTDSSSCVSQGITEAVPRCHQFQPSTDLLSVPTLLDSSSSERNSSCDGGDNNTFLDDDDDDDDDSLPDEPLLAGLLLERRSSYGGSLHTASPPPPNNALGRRWSVPGGDAALEEGWTREVQRRSGKKLPRYVAGIGRAIRGVGSTRQKSSLASKEMLDSVIDLLSCRQETRSDKNLVSSSSSSPHHSNVLRPQCASSDWPPPTTGQSQHPSSLTEGHSKGGGGGNWGWTSPVRSSSTDNCGLLTVAAAAAATSTSFKNRDLKNEGWSNSHRQLSHMDGIPPKQKTISTSPPIVSAGTKQHEESSEVEGAFSIGLNLSGNNLMSSVQQWRRENDKSSSIPVVLTPPVEDKWKDDFGSGSMLLTARTDTPYIPNSSPNADSSIIIKTGNQDKPGINGETVWSVNSTLNDETAAFLSLALEGSPGKSIWTPSPNDYTSSRGNSLFQMRTINSLSH